MSEVSAALKQAVQPDAWRSRRGGETRAWRGYELATNTDSRFLLTSCPTSGGGSGGGGSLALARMNSGTGERLSARPQPASMSAPPASMSAPPPINPALTIIRPIPHFYLNPVKITQ